jgi:sortase A
MTDPSTIVARGLLVAPARPALGAVRRTVREVGLAMIVGGIVILLFVVYQLFGTTLTEQRDQASLARSFHAANLHGGGVATAPVTAAPSRADASTVQPAAKQADNLSPSTPQGSAIEHLEIPKIGVNRYVVQGTSEQNLMQGPGHYVNTPFPGQAGNAAIAGHRTTYGAPFFRLNELVIGDKIYVTNTKGATFVYAVVRRLIAQATGPSAAAVLADTRISELTLTTCNPRFEAINRLVVVADLMGRPAAKAVASPTLPVTRSSPAAVPVQAATNTLGNGNAGAWPPAIGYGAAALAVWVGTRLALNRTRRWRRVASLVLGIAVGAVPLWYCFENVVRILPQSI